MHAVPGVYERERRGGAEGYATQVSSSEEFSFTLHARKQVVVWSNNLGPRSKEVRWVVVVAWSGFMFAHTCGTIHAFVARAMSPATIAMSSHTVKTMIPQHVAIVVVWSLVLVLDLLVSGELQLFFCLRPCIEVQRKISQNQNPPHHEWRERVQITSCAREFACVTPFFDFSIWKYRSKRKKEAQPSTPCAEQSR